MYQQERSERLAMLAETLPELNKAVVDLGIGIRDSFGEAADSMRKAGFHIQADELTLKASEAQESFDFMVQLIDTMTQHARGVDTGFGPKPDAVRDAAVASLAQARATLDSVGARYQRTVR